MLARILFWGVFATVVACIEIESEGKEGWAEKAPTWYRVTSLPARIYGKIMSGKPLTGYHSFMFFFPILLFHAHFFMGVPWSLPAELLAWALYFAWCPMWDYHWFVLNPAYAGKFSPKYIWWHAKSYWIGGLFPADYLMGAFFSMALAGAAGWLAHSSEMILDHLSLLGGFIAYTMALHAVAPQYSRWYAYMRRPGSDERGKVNIFDVDE